MSPALTGRREAGVLRVIDRLGDGLGLLAGWLFFATGVMLVWEVVARYVFVAPTIWAEELARDALLWGTFLGMAVLLRRREHIRITLLIGLLGDRGRWLAELLTLLFIAGFAASTAWYGWWIAHDSLVTGRTTGSMLDIPQWWSEVVIPVGFAILALQALAEIARLLGGAVPPPPERGQGSEG